MDIVIIITLILIIGVIFLLLQNTNTPTRSQTVKKDDIIKNYEKNLKDILSKHENNKDKQIEQKKLFLQKCSSELSRNIFFNPDEAKLIIQKLATL